MCIHRLDRKTQWKQIISAVWVRKVDVNGKNNLDIFEPQVKVEKTFKIFEVEAVVSAEIWLRWVFQDFSVRVKLIEKSRGKVQRRRLVGLVKTQLFAKPRPNSLKYFRKNWKPHQKFREYFFTSRLIYFTLVSHTLVPIKFIGHCIKPNWRP